MSEKEFSAGKFTLDRVGYSTEAWVTLGKITVISGCIEGRLLEIPSYIEMGCSGVSHWEFPNGKPVWSRLCDAVQSSARAANLDDLGREFCQATGAARSAFKERGKLSHASFFGLGDGVPKAGSAVRKSGAERFEMEWLDVSDGVLLKTLNDLTTAYDWLESCCDGLSYARRKRSSPPNRNSCREAAEALLQRGNVPHSRDD